MKVELIVETFQSKYSFHEINWWPLLKQTKLYRKMHIFNPIMKCSLNWFGIELQVSWGLKHQLSLIIEIFKFRIIIIFYFVINKLYVSELNSWAEPIMEIFNNKPLEWFIRHLLLSSRKIRTKPSNRTLLPSFYNLYDNPS